MLLPWFDLGPLPSTPVALCQLFLMGPLLQHRSKSFRHHAICSNQQVYELPVCCIKWDLEKRCLHQRQPWSWCRCDLLHQVRPLATNTAIMSMQAVLRYEGNNRAEVTALSVTPEDCVVAGSREGCMLAFAPDSRRRIKDRVNLADCNQGLATI